MKYGILEFVHHFVAEQVPEGGSCIDATAGNGHDTVFLGELVGKNGRVLAMDIQEAAVLQTKSLVEKKQMQEWVKVVRDSHVSIQNYAEENSVDCVMFNLGYLPGGDHTISTEADTSICAMERALPLLKKNGVLSVTIYSGGDSGFEERNRVLEWMRNLDSKKYLVLVTEYFNRPNHPPIPVFLVKL